MIIQVDGAGSINKGAQLMLIAVMQEIKRKNPDAKLIVNHPRAGDAFVKAFYGENCIIKRKESFYQNVAKFHLIHLTGLISRKLACFFTVKHAYKGIDVVFNIGGFQFGDQWHHNEKNVADWRDYLRKLKQYGTKIIFFPQAFGPFEKKWSKKLLEVINEYADVIMARDDISYEYLVEGGVIKGKLLLYPDFTGLVKGVETEYSKQHKGKVCIIPNSKIIQTGIMDKESYLSSLAMLIDHVFENGYGVVLLNHEGIDDYNLCKLINSKSSKSVDIVTGLNAIETKGMIAASYMVISSRFHGVANALSSGVPCLATSWSHKYQKLLEEYDQHDKLIDLSDMGKALVKIDNMLDQSSNDEIRYVLNERNEMVEAKNRNMWDVIWKKVCDE